MPVERTAGSANLVEVLDRVLDRGLRWDPGVRAARLHPPPSGGALRLVVTFMEVRTADTPARGDTPRAPSPGA